MTRAVVLRDLVAHGHGHGADRLSELATELDLPVTDLFVVAGQPVPTHLLPPDRDRAAVRAFTYRVTYCDHAQLAALKDYVTALAAENPAPEGCAVPPVPPSTGRFAQIVAGLLRNRGLTARELPFTGLSRSTINGLLAGRHRNPQQLKAVAGPLGWRFRDLMAVADEPLAGFNDCSTLCHHVGEVYAAAIPLATGPLVQALRKADRLSGRVDHGAWQPVVHSGHVDCPDPDGRHWGAYQP